MVYELRNLPAAPAPMREEDLATLADALGGTPEAIEARLHELIGRESREEAAQLRSMILPPRSLAMARPPWPPPAPGRRPPSVVPAAHFDFATAAPSIGDAAAADPSSRARRR